MTYVVISSGHLRGLGDVAPPFAEQIGIGRSALRELSIKSMAVRASTDPAIANVGVIAGRFADEIGPRLLTEAEQTSDAAKVIRVQTATKNMIAAVSPEVMPAAISRFLLMVVTGPAGAVIPAETVDAARDQAQQAADEAIDSAKQGLENAAEGSVKLLQALAKAAAEQATSDIVGTALALGGLGLLAYLYVQSRK